VAFAQRELHRHAAYGRSAHTAQADNETVTLFGGTGWSHNRCVTRWARYSS